MSGFLYYEGSCSLVFAKRNTLERNYSVENQASSVCSIDTGKKVLVQLFQISNEPFTHSFRLSLLM